MMKIRVFVTTLVTAILIPVISMAGSVVLIGNPSVPASALNKYDVKSIFLGDMSAWDDGSEIIIVVQKDSTAHKTFLRNYINKTPIQFKNYWKKQVFTGKGFAPPSRDGDKEIIDFVTQTKGAIGYVSSDSGLENVKIIKVR